MKMNEYKNIEGFSYIEYCDYLQKKYGIGVCNYMTKNWNINKKCKRSKEGIVAHHKFESHAQLLANVNEAKNYPFEWQMAENIVYCDYLEHLLLHILICEESIASDFEHGPVGIGGILQFIVPELNDVYSGWKSAQEWRATCHSKIIDDKDVYLELIKRFKTNCKEIPLCDDCLLMKSYNEQYGLWDRKNNQALFDEIAQL